MSAALILTAAPQTARGDATDDTTVARDLFREGAAFAQAGNWEHALDRYRRSLKIKRASLTLYSIGVAQKQLGKLVEARESFTAFLAEPSSAATQPYEYPAKVAIEEIDAHVGRLTIQVTPADAPGLSVTLDGVVVEPWDLAIARPANPGPHAITARATGRAEARSNVTVREGEAVIASLTLREAGAEEAAPPRPPPASLAPDSRVAPIVLMSLGASALVTGGAILALGVFDRSNAPSGDAFVEDSTRGKWIVGGVTGGVGVLALIGGVALNFAVSSPEAGLGAKKTTAVEVWVKSNGAGLKVSF